MWLPDVPTVIFQSPEDLQEDALVVVQLNVYSVPISTCPDWSDIKFIIAEGIEFDDGPPPPPPPPPPQLEMKNINTKNS